MLKLNCLRELVVSKKNVDKGKLARGKEKEMVYFNKNSLFFKFVFLSTFVTFCFPSYATTNVEILKAKEEIILNSTKSYRGNCPCPYSFARNNSRCGKRSAYSRSGGASPYCYVEDISDEEALKFIKLF